MRGKKLQWYFWYWLHLRSLASSMSSGNGSNKHTVKNWNTSPNGSGPLYTRSQGQCSTQIKHPYCCKSWNQPPWLYSRSSAEIENIFSICPKLLTNAELYGLVLTPRLKRRIASNLGSQFCNPWGQCSSLYSYRDVNVLAFC